MKSRLNILDIPSKIMSLEQVVLTAVVGCKGEVAETEPLATFYALVVY